MSTPPVQQPDPALARNLRALAAARAREPAPAVAVDPSPAAHDPNAERRRHLQGQIEALRAVRAAME